MMASEAAEPGIGTLRTAMQNPDAVKTGRGAVPVACGNIKIVWYDTVSRYCHLEGGGIGLRKPVSGRAGP
jgi:hypothetical protein